MTDPAIKEAAARALEEFRQAFVVAVGDQSPFAKQALLRADAAIAAIPLIEAAALEEAAKEADKVWGDAYELRIEWFTDQIAAAIRALKEQP